MVARGCSTKQISRTLRLAVSTIAHWRTEPPFRAEVARRIAQACARIEAMVIDATVGAIKTLVAESKNPEAKSIERTSAARALLDRQKAIAEAMAEARDIEQSIEEDAKNLRDALQRMRASVPTKPPAPTPPETPA